MPRTPGTQKVYSIDLSAMHWSSLALYIDLQRYPAALPSVV
tara:strand:- start:461 stop:583 length:123 start_codon:yes stop_codon:yes gene_type:complete